MNDSVKEAQDDKIFDLQEENKKLRARITFLQEEVGTLDDEILCLQKKLNEN